MRLVVRASLAAIVTVVSFSAVPIRAVLAQTGVGASLTPYAGYFVTGHWYDGPIGTSLSTTNSPMVGAQGTIPLSKGVALVGNLAYASGDLRVGLPLIGGVTVGSATTWLYDAGLELGGLAGRTAGIAPFVSGGIGGMTNDIRNSLFNTRASNVAYTAALGLDVGLTPGFGVRIQAKDWIGRFNSQDAVGFRANGNLAHNWALTAGAKISF